MSKSIFDEFTNQYALSKTLRFELKPVGETQKMLIDAKVFEKDETIHKKYEATKPFLDRLHRDFVQEALENVVLSGLNGYLELFKKWKTDKKTFEKELQKKEKDLRKEVVQFFDSQAKTWSEQYNGLKNKDVSILSEEAVFESLLKVRYGEEEGTQVVDEATGEIVSIFDSWKGFTGYFDKFFATRRNFYKVDGTSTALATRIIDQNLKRFCDNILNYEKVKDKVDFLEVEQNFNKDISEVFSISFYNSCLLQQGIDFYNKILGGETLKNGEKKKGINEIINKYRQDNKGEKLPFLKSLDKQILSEKEKVFIDEIIDDEQLLTVLKDFYKSAEQKIAILHGLFTDFIDHKEDYNLSGIYLSKEAFNTISRKWTNETDIFEKSLYEAMKVEKLAKYEKNDQSYKFPDFIALSYISNALENVGVENFWKERYYKIANLSKKTIWEQFLAIFYTEFNNLFELDVIDEVTNEPEKIGFKVFRADIESLLRNFSNDEKSKVIIKNFADSVLKIYQMAKYFAVEKKRKWIGDDYDLGEFYQNPNFGYKEKFYDGSYEEIVQVYNKIRNYLTKKPYSEEKWKLNFENPTLADGWDKNKESANTAVLLMKDGKYYLGLMKKGCNKIFDDRHKDDFKEDISMGKYRKVVYKFFPDQAKMFPKVCFSVKGLAFFQPPVDILNIYKNSEFKKGDTFSLKSMHRLIDFYKDCLGNYDGWKCYDFKHLKSTEDYKDNIGEFFRDVAEDGYKLTYQDISDSYINDKNNNGELYLFQIKNKDWNEGAMGAKNLHTLYFDSLFSLENITQNFPFKINGQAEIFYRRKTKGLKKEEIITQAKGVKLDENNHKGDKAYQKNRFTENKIFFHVPLTLNRTKPEMSSRKYNEALNDFLANNSNINIIGVDRGEKHLAYYSVINQMGIVIESGSLNKIDAVNYAEKLEEKAKKLEQARKDWQEVEGIKDLKKGYISQVVRKLADLAVKHNAIIVFEDLNIRFKQIRGGIEKSVYQQLEKALIEKLNFLVNKGEKDAQEAGHLLRAYQLAAPFTTFKEMGKQTGIIFYTQAAYTSKIDPITGWRPHLYLKYSSAERAKTDIRKFAKIEFKDGRFEFTYDIMKYRDQKSYPKKTVWTVCSNVERFRWNRQLNNNNNNKGAYDHYENITDNLKKLFEKYHIDYERGDILAQIGVLDVRGNESLFRDIIFFFNLICQIRNTDEAAIEEYKRDYILSPVEPFFDSRKNNGKNLPKNGDDNGAYNIARKGILILDKISSYAKDNGSCQKMSWGDLFISGEEWDNFATKK